MTRKQQLDSVFCQLKEDERVTSVHVALYGTLARIWKAAHYANPFPVDKAVARQASKIRSETSLDKHLQELELWGYLQYFSSLEPNQYGVISLQVPGVAWSANKRPRKSRLRAVLTPLPEPEEGYGWSKLIQVVVQALVQLLIALMNRHFHLF